MKPPSPPSPPLSVWPVQMAAATAHCPGLPGGAGRRGARALAAGAAAPAAAPSARRAAHDSAAGAAAARRHDPPAYLDPDRSLGILTTNRPEILEPALASRPGRVDLAVEIPAPDAECRRRLFDLYGRGLTMRVTDPQRWVQRTEGVSAAFIRELLRKAALFAADDTADGVVVEDRHLDAALHELVVQGGDLTRSLLGVRGST